MEFRRGLTKCKKSQVLFGINGSAWPAGTFLSLLPLRAVPRFVGCLKQDDPSPGTAALIAHRQAAMDFGRVSVALEGLKCSPEGEALQQQWVRGEISMQEYIDTIKHRYGNPPIFRAR